MRMAASEKAPIESEIGRAGKRMGERTRESGETAAVAVTEGQRHLAVAVAAAAVAAAAAGAAAAAAAAAAASSELPMVAMGAVGAVAAARG